MDGSSILLSQNNGNVSPSERATSSLASGAVGMGVGGVGERLTGSCWEFSSAGPRSLWLRSCSTASHFGSKVPTPPQTKRERNQK